LPFCGRAPRDTLELAFQALNHMAPISASSSYYASPAWPNPGDPAFVNAVARINTAMAPVALLQALHAIEAGFGRLRGAPNTPRTLDLDLIAYDDHIREADSASPLRLPHPAIASRAFVLAPIAEIASAWRHPVSGLTAGAMLAALGPSETALIGENP